VRRPTGSLTYLSSWSQIKLIQMQFVIFLQTMHRAGGKTCSALSRSLVLYWTLLRALQKEGPQAWFVKSQRGKFGLRSAI
jgi:hypothetical protein